jgi:hypothetical protein
MNPEKTYKRETGAILILFWMGLVVWGVYNPEALQAAEFAILPVFTFASGAFAMDAVFKQKPKV